MVPSYLPYEPSPLDLRILRYVIALTGADYCYRSIRENLPVPYRDMVPTFAPSILDVSPTCEFRT